jgi:hypothetical protein
LTTGSLTTSVEMGSASTRRRKPSGSPDDPGPPRGSDAASTAPEAENSPRWRTSRFWRTAAAIERGTRGASAERGGAPASGAVSPRPARSTSTPSTLRLRAAWAPLTKRSAWLWAFDRTRSCRRQPKNTALAPIATAMHAAMP